MNDNNFVYAETNNGITAGGYKLESMFLNNKMPALSNFLNSNGKDLAIPHGLLMIKGGLKNNIKPFKVEVTESIVDNKLFDNLLNLLNKKKPQRKTRKTAKKKQKRKTRKH